jgi:hypothetical protein
MDVGIVTAAAARGICYKFAVAARRFRENAMRDGE